MAEAVVWVQAIFLPDVNFDVFFLCLYNLGGTFLF